MVKSAISNFSERMNDVMMVLAREFSRRQADELHKGKITLPQFLILDYLNKQGQTKMTDLAHFMDVSTAAMTGIVDRLVRSGYVERITEPEDRRIVKIKPTHKGSNLVKRIHQQRSHMTIQIFSRISRRERLQYLRTLMHIRDILTRQKLEN